MVDSAALSDDPWVFSTPAHRDLLAKLHDNSVQLLELPTQISRGSSTGNDDIFILREQRGRYRTRDGEMVAIEKGILRTPIYATDFGRFRFTPSGSERVIFPYVVEANGYRILEEKKLAESYPKAYSYLKRCKKRLRQRKQFKKWYGFSAPRSLDVHCHAHLMVPLLANKGLFCVLPAEMKQYCPMASGGFTIAVSDQQPMSPLYVLGVLNSRLLYWVLENISNRFRGGWITCTKQYVGRLPIHSLDISQKSDKSRHDRMVQLVEAMLGLNRQLAAARTANDKTLIQRQITATDNQIDRLSLRSLRPDGAGNRRGGRDKGGLEAAGRD